jgi:NADH:ubiquinone oxidoreductase subunit F (NADH-binding)
MTDLLRTPAAWPRILLDRADAADPLDLDAAVRDGAFEGLHKAVHELGPTATIAVVAASALRGRGGAGFPTGEKWRMAARHEADRRYVVANGYEADPATRTDRTLMERVPYSVVEGAAIAAWAIGAAEAIIAVRAEATEAIRALEAAIGEAEAAGFIGADATATGRELTVSVRPVRGAYMLGEETVLLKALEGKRGQPEQRPPYPTERGLFGRPTVVNNVATLASVPWILRNGPEAFAAIGSTTSPGTVLVHLRGPASEGIAEIPSGTPLRELLGLIGDVGRGHSLKAVLVGGPSAGILPPALLDTPYEPGALEAAGAHVGSGSIVLADERACVVDLGRLLTTFCASEACGKTIPCRIGTRRLQEIGDRIVDGRPQPSDLTLLDDLSHDIVASALCDHERLATLPLLSAMRYFRSELDDHLLRSSCPAGVCRPIAMAPAGVAH